LRTVADSCTPLHAVENPCNAELEAGQSAPPGHSEDTWPGG
jgi:hypothetical protein